MSAMRSYFFVLICYVCLFVVVFYENGSFISFIAKFTGLVIEHFDSSTQPPRECCCWSPSRKCKTRAFDFAVKPNI